MEKSWVRLQSTALLGRKWTVAWKRWSVPSWLMTSYYNKYDWVSLGSLITKIGKPSTVWSNFRFNDTYAKPASQKVHALGNVMSLSMNGSAEQCSGFLHCLAPNWLPLPSDIGPCGPINHYGLEPAHPTLCPCNCLTNNPALPVLGRFYGLR